MALFDLPLEELVDYRAPDAEPPDFDEFWTRTLDESSGIPLTPRFTRVETPLSALEVFDVEFAGAGGHPVRGWFLLPVDRTGPVPVVVKYLGYTNGRGLPHDWTLWPAAGFAMLVMDSRGQGANDVHRPGVTGDPAGSTSPHAFGMLTSGILQRDEYYYRRLFVDAYRAVDVARSRAEVDADCIVLDGESQGGGIATAVAGLRHDIRAAMINVPFLSHMRRAVEITDQPPYSEVRTFLRARRDAVDTAMTTLSYFDGIHFAARATATALYSVALMDRTCPPSTVFASFNAYAGAKRIEVWPFNDHEGGSSAQTGLQLTWLVDILADRPGSDRQMP